MRKIFSLLFILLSLPIFSQIDEYVLERNGNERLTRGIDKITYRFDGEHYYEVSWIGSHKYESLVDTLGDAHFYTTEAAPLWMVPEDQLNGWDFVLTNNKFNLCYKQSETESAEEYVLIQDEANNRFMFRFTDGDVSDFIVNDKFYIVAYDKSKSEFSIYTIDANGKYELCYTGKTEHIEDCLALAPTYDPPTTEIRPNITDHVIRFSPKILDIFDYVQLYRNLSNAQSVPEFMTTLGSFIGSATIGIIISELLGPAAIGVVYYHNVIVYYDQLSYENNTKISLGSANCQITGIHPIDGGSLEVSVLLSNANTIPERVYYANNSSSSNHVSLYLLGSTQSYTSNEYDSKYSSSMIDIPFGSIQGYYTFTVKAPRKDDNYNTSVS